MVISTFMVCISIMAVFNSAVMVHKMIRTTILDEFVLFSPVEVVIILISNSVILMLAFVLILTGQELIL